MNIANIYEKATTPQDGVKGQLDSAEQQRKATVKLEEAIEHNSWVANKTTKKMFDELKQQANELETQATMLAVTYHQHNNHQQIIGLLQQVATIDKIIETYGRTK